jgi:hypothetical protein
MPGADVAADWSAGINGPAEGLPDDRIQIATTSRGANRELRIRWREFKEHHFLELCEWSVNPDNSQWWPEGKGSGLRFENCETAHPCGSVGRTSEVPPWRPGGY